MGTEVLHEGGRTKVLFTRPLDNNVTAITLGGNTPLVWAYGPGDKLAYHQANRGSIHINFANTIIDVTEDVTGQNQKILHGALMFIGWGMFIPLGSLAAVCGGSRFEAGGQTYFDAHRVLQSTGLIATMVGVIDIVFSLYGHEFSKAFVEGLPKHGYFGFAIMLFGIAQPLNAFCRPSKDNENRATWEFLHKNLGRILTFLGFANCILGSLLAKQQHKTVAMFNVFLILSIISAVLWLFLHIAGKMRPMGSKGIDLFNIEDDSDAESSSNVRTLLKSEGDSVNDNNNNVNDPFSLPPLSSF